MYCPRCGNVHINHFENNRPVADFYCPVCRSEYELKSKEGGLGHKVADGAYSTMVERITSNNNPDFFFMSYSKRESRVNDLILIPKHFFVPAVIEKRKPLAPTARRAGWIGCNIVISMIPKQGVINIISDGKEADRNTVVDKLAQANRLITTDINSRGWLMDILNCINSISTEEFTLEEIYRFEELLRIKHPQNNNIRVKIRQQLQILRDRGFVHFWGNGKYLKLNGEEQREEI